MCQNFSPLLSECQELAKANTVANAHGGKVRSSVMVVLKPRVLVMVGMYWPKERPMMKVK